VRYTGPRGSGDYVTIVPPDAAPDHYEGYFSVDADGTEGELAAPDRPGAYELRYVTSAPETENPVLVRRPTTIR
jgi:Ca-activated chloride channel family protein